MFLGAFMSLHTSCKRNYEFYKEHLSLINDLKFTHRETDVLACILHNRGEKKIASVLSISPRTVSVHVYNVMNKLGCNTKDQIIDFIESSGKLSFFREYYLHLLLRAHFEKELTQQGSRHNRGGITVYYYRDESLLVHKDLYQSIQRHFKLARINLQEMGPEETHTPLLDLSTIMEAGYYEDVLHHVLELINPSQRAQMMEDFERASQTILNNHEGTSSPSKNKTSHILNTKGKIVGTSCLTILFLATIFYIFPYFYARKCSVAELPAAVQDLEKFLKTVKEQKFNANNCHGDQIKKNHSAVKNIEKLIEYKKLNEVSAYLSKASMSSETLMQYLHNLQALATYYMYNMQDGKKAADILLHVKQLAEKYVNIRGKVHNDFDNLKKEEILTEINIVKDLPQMYTRIIYSLGRTFIYNKNSEEGRKYFELAHYLGNKLGLYEGYLSQTSGLLLLDAHRADALIAENKYTQARPLLIQAVKSYKALAKDQKSYFADYEPGIEEQKFRTPQESPYNRFDCTMRIIENYRRLIPISKDSNEINSFITEIAQFLQEDQAVPSHLLKTKNQVPERKLANLLNILGDLTLALWHLKAIDNLPLHDVKLKRSIVAAFLAGQTYNGKTNMGQDDLQLAESLFTLACDKSRSTDFTKVDAYKGLIATYQNQLNHTHGLSEGEQKAIKERISRITQKLQAVDNKQP